MVADHVDLEESQHFVESIFPPSQYGDYDRVLSKGSSRVTANESGGQDEYDQEIEKLLKKYTENDIQ